MIRLYIENNEMDVTEGFSNQITYAVDDLQNLDSKATAFSKTIVLPGTSKNNYLLGNIFEFSNANFTGLGDNVGYNFNASRSAKCRLEINGLQIIKGVLRLLEIVRDGDSIEYEVAIFGELGGFFTSLSNKRLDDLDFSSYDHTYTIANIKDRWKSKADWIYITNEPDVALVNSTTSFADVFAQEDLSLIIKPGDSINFTNYTTSTDYGTYVVSTIVYDGVNKNTITISGTFTSPPGASFKGKLTIADKGGYGVYYPLIDYGNYSTDKKNYRYRTFRPALFVREYLHKIITSNGYTYESKFFETDFFKRLIIPHSEAKFLTLVNDVFKGNFYGYVEERSYGVINRVDTVPIQSYFGEGFNTSDNRVFTYISTNGNLVFNFDLSFRIQTVYTRIFTLTAEIYKNGSGTGIIKTISGNTNLPPTTDPNYYFKYSDLTLSFVNESVSFVTNDTFEIRYTLNVSAVIGVSNPLVTLSFYNTEIFIQSEYPVTAEISLNDNVYLNKVLPKNVLQKDFFASILKMFYLMVTEDKYKEKHLKIEPWTWFYNLNPSSYLDWSQKLDRSQPIRIRPMSETNSRFYEIKFKADTDYYNDYYKKKYNEGYGDVKYDNALEFAKDAQTTEVIFASTPLLGYEDEDKIVPAIFKWDGKTIGTNEETVNSIIRIMQAKTITSEITAWDILDMSPTPNVLDNDNTTYPYAGHFDDPDVPGSDLNFGATKELFFAISSGALGNNLFNIFYSSYLAEITDKDSRLVTAKFKLNDTDIFNLDFGRFIFLDGVLYRLSKVVDYTPGEICTVELLRVIYTTYDNSVNAAPDPEIFINGLVWEGKNYEGEYYRNGDPIPQITDEAEWEGTTNGAWCYYENNTANGVEYGKLYNWYAVNDARGFAPEGWRVPTETELIGLGTYAGGGYALKEIGTTHWNTDNGTDDFGFAALGAGRRRYTGAYEHLKTYAYYWTADEYDTDEAYYARIQDASNTFGTNKVDKNTGFSVRLIKDV